MASRKLVIAACGTRLTATSHELEAVEWLSTYDVRLESRKATGVAELHFAVLVKKKTNTVGHTGAAVV